MKETEDELTIKAFPLVMWSIAFLVFAGAFYFVLSYFQFFDNFAQFSQLFKQGIFVTLTNLFALLFLPVGGLIFLYYFPLITTKVNRREKTVRIEKFGILGKRVKIYSFDSLDGGFRVKAEEDEDNKEHLKLYFNLKSGQRIFLSSDLTSYWKGKAYDVAMKAN